MTYEFRERPHNSNFAFRSHPGVESRFLGEAGRDQRKNYSFKPLLNSAGKASAK